MRIFKEIVAILVVSLVGGLVLNAISPHGINVLDNPWSTNKSLASVERAEQSTEVVSEDPIRFVEFNQTCRFMEKQEGMILDARSPEEYAQGHIPGAYLFFFYKMNEYYPKLKDRMNDSSALLVYCGDIHCDDSEFLANELFNLGHAPIFVYKGGFKDWQSNQGCVETGMEDDECW